MPRQQRDAANTLSVISFVRRDDGRGGVVNESAPWPVRRACPAPAPSSVERPRWPSAPTYVPLGFAHGLRPRPCAAWILGFPSQAPSRSAAKAPWSTASAPPPPPRGTPRLRAAVPLPSSFISAFQQAGRRNPAGRPLRELEHTSSAKSRVLCAGKFMRPCCSHCSHRSSAARGTARPRIPRGPRQDPDVHALTPFFRHPAHGK